MHRKLTGFWLVVAVSLVGAPAALGATGTTIHASSTVGRAPLVKPNRSAAQPGAQALTNRSHGARRYPRTGAATRALTAPPRATATPTPPAPLPLLANFNGTSSRDSANTNFGAEFEPPDQGLCVGNGFVIDMTNSAYTVYRPNGSVVTGPFNVNGPFNEGLIEFTSDPRCYFDKSTNTWFATVVFISADATRSSVDLAVNTTGDPTKLWQTYKIDTTAVGGATGPRHSGCPCFGDQPRLGIDSENVYITTDDFSILGPQFNGAQGSAVSKSALVSGAGSAHFVHFDRLSIGGDVAGGIQPASTNGPDPGAELFLNSLDPTGGGDTRVGVWAMTRRNLVSTGGRPTLSSRVITSEPYAFPPPGQQRGNSAEIDTGDDRMQQTQSIGGFVWGALTTDLTPPGDTTDRAGVAWFKVKPTIASNVLSAAQMAAQGYVSLRFTHVMYPAIQVTPAGTAAMALSLTGASRYPSAGYATMPAGGTVFSPVSVAGAGTGPYDPNSSRWGDYSYAALDPSGKTIWGAAEYIPPRASQTVDRAANWGTRVFRINAP